MNQLVPIIADRVPALIVAGGAKTAYSFHGVSMTRIIESRSEKNLNEEMLTFRVEKNPTDPEQVVGVWSDTRLTEHGSIFSGTAPKAPVPVAEAFLSALAYCEKEDVGALWVRDPFGLFPLSNRPAR